MMKDLQANSLRIALIKTNVLECPDQDMNFSSNCCYGSQFNISVCLNFQSPQRVNPHYLVCFLRLMPEIKSASTYLLGAFSGLENLESLLTFRVQVTE